MGGEGALSSHAGVHTGPVIERDRDVFGHTVNLASRIADVAGPGEVLTTEAVVEGLRDGTFGFERIEDPTRGTPRPGRPLSRHTNRVAHHVSVGVTTTR